MQKVANRSIMRAQELAVFAAVIAIAAFQVFKVVTHSQDPTAALQKLQTDLEGEGLKDFYWSQEDAPNRSDDVVRIAFVVCGEGHRNIGSILNLAAFFHLEGIRVKVAIVPNTPYPGPC